MSYHPHTVDEWVPPPHVVDHLVAHAVRNIKGTNQLKQHLPTHKSPQIPILMGLKPHKYHSGGTLQFGFVN